MRASHDVAIVGLGAMGSAAAYHLSRRGKRVMEEAWLLLGSGYPPETVRSLFQRIVDRQRQR